MPSKTERDDTIMNNRRALIAATGCSAWLLAAAIVLAALGSPAAFAAAPWTEAASPGASDAAITLGRDLDNDGDPDEINIRLEIVELQQEVYPGKFVTFWVFAPEGQGMAQTARAPSPTIRVEEGDRVRITLLNTHYFPHTIHLHGTIHPNAMDGVPDITQKPVNPGEAFVYDFIAKNPGTHFYHCHVQPDVHVMMGMVGMLIIEPNRPGNLFTHVILGAGLIPDLAKAAVDDYDREYSMVYTDIDDRLNRIPHDHSDPREIEKRMHRDYDSTQRRPNIFMLNGRAFPFTLRDSPIEVKPDERIRLRVLNAGARTMSLHTHGHHPIATHLDGYPVPEPARQPRDVFTIGAAQRVDLELRTSEDGIHASGPGVWLMHDHVEDRVTNMGIAPGGDQTAIVYESHKGKNGLPRTVTSLEKYFNPAYYRGEIPVFDPKIFHSTAEDYERGWKEAAGGKPAYPLRDPGAFTELRVDPLASHTIVAGSCGKPRGFRRVHVKAGDKLALAGEVFGFAPREIRVGKCEEVEIVLENVDSIRHTFMVPGLNPMFAMEFAGPATRRARFVTPDKDVTLEFHCHVPSHEKMGMMGRLIVGGGGPAAPVHMPQHRGGQPLASTPAHRHGGGTAQREGDGHTHGAPQVARVSPRPAASLHSGVGVVISTDIRTGRIIVDHEEIPGFMAPMVMNYLVTPATLLSGLGPRDRIGFTIDADKRVIVDIKRVQK